MVKAIWNGKVVAESTATVVVEGNHYFPPDAVQRQFLSDSDDHSTCHWKGVASYYDLDVDGKRNPAAAWYYPAPLAEAAELKDHVAFWKGVKIQA